ncbi:MAG: hypothetical protein HQ581_17660 [Planctomycetes bacterium]|nr:hypothetical protein [Planctomycetota bacterium]
MLTRRILDVIADVLTLLALAVAGAGHMLPWVEIRVEQPEQKSEAAADAGQEKRPGRVDHYHHMSDRYRYEPVPIEFQIWHASRSGIALAAAAVLVGLSLVFRLGVIARKFLVLLMFASTAAAVAFQLMIYSPYPFTEAHRSLETSSLHELDGYFVAMIPSIIAGVLCTLRMGWTMTASAQPAAPRYDLLDKAPDGETA